MNATITVLVDNHADPGLLAEHGLSLWIEAEGLKIGSDRTAGRSAVTDAAGLGPRDLVRGQGGLAGVPPYVEAPRAQVDAESARNDRSLKILFDSGQGEALPPNAERLGIPVEGAGHIVLSHGHYDHGGALAWVLSRNQRAPVYLHPAARRERYSLRDGHARSIGLPPSAAAALDALPPARVHSVTAPTLLSPRVGLTGPIPRRTTFEDTGGPFFLDAEGLTPDPIEDDQALWIVGEEGLTVCLGCGHAGVINTLRYIQEVSGEARVHTILGGLHLRSASSERLEATIEALRALAPARIAPCHCTGDGAIEALQRALGDIVRPPRAGATLQIR